MKALMALGLAALILAALLTMTAYAKGSYVEERLKGVGRQLRETVATLIDMALRFLHSLLLPLATFLGVVGLVVYAFDRYHGMRLIYGAILLTALWLVLPALMSW